MLSNVTEFERRFLLRREQAERFIHEVAPHLHLDVYDATRPVGYSRTTYLDTDDLAYYRSWNAHVARRVRIREYASAPDVGAPPMLTGICALELKESSGMLRTKARFRAPPELIEHIVARGGEVPPDAPEALEEMQAFRAIQTCLRADRLGARVQTWYRRASLTGAGGRVRITLDEGIAFGRPQGIGQQGELATPVDIIDYGPGRVLEVKYQGEPPAWLLTAAAGLTESTGLSKFRLGMLALKRAERVPSRHSTMPISIPAPIRVKKE